MDAALGSGRAGRAPPTRTGLRLAYALPIMAETFRQVAAGEAFATDRASALRDRLLQVARPTTA
jgi:hypothetical protein